MKWNSMYNISGIMPHCNYKLLLCVRSTTEIVQHIFAKLGTNVDHD